MNTSSIEKEIADIETQINASTAGASSEPSSAITKRQEIQNRIGQAARDEMNFREAAELNKPRLAEQRQQLTEMEGFAAVAKAKLDQVRFSSRRLELAMQADSVEQFAWGLCAVDDTVDALDWWLETYAGRIARQKAVITKTDKMIRENEDLAAQACRVLSAARDELKGYDRLTRAEAKTAARLDGTDF
jgi:hypothetical protein